MSRKRLVSWVLVAALWLVVIVGWSRFDPLVVGLLLLAAVIMPCVMIAFRGVRWDWSSIDGGLSSASPVVALSDGGTLVVQEEAWLRSVPASVAEARVMDAKEFEYLSAALVMAKVRGHRFERHCGGRGDRGVDTILRNAAGSLIAVQSKRYNGHAVKPTEVRDFSGAMKHFGAWRGYFVTSSRLTKAAMQEVHTSEKIEVIDEGGIEALLQHRRREVGLALREVKEVVGE